MFGNSALDTQVARKDAPAEQDAAPLYTLPVAAEWRLAQRVTWVSNKPSEHNSGNMPRVQSATQFPEQQHSSQTLRLLSRPIRMLAGLVMRGGA